MLYILVSLRLWVYNTYLSTCSLIRASLSGALVTWLSQDIVYDRSHLWLSFFLSYRFTPNIPLDTRNFILCLFYS